VAVDNRDEIRQFLTSRRARITPAQAGLPAYGANRRVPGLRREEVALLAGVSVDYYTRLERGNLGGVSEAVLDALARALQLDEAERGHLFDLARAANTTARPRRRPARQRVRPGIQRILDAITDTPADVRSRRGPRADLRGDGAAGRPGAVAGGVRGRARVRLPGRPQAPGQLGGDPRPASDGRGARGHMTGSVPAAPVPVST
jgi:transcriptional regulator with XRE-family HTH domain